MRDRRVVPLASSFCTRVMRFPMRVASLVCPADVAVASRACALVTHAAALASRALILGTRARALVQSTLWVGGVAGVAGVLGVVADAIPTAPRAIVPDSAPMATSLRNMLFSFI